MSHSIKLRILYCIYKAHANLSKSKLKLSKFFACLNLYLVLEDEYSRTLSTISCSGNFFLECKFSNCFFYCSDFSKSHFVNINIIKYRKMSHINLTISVFSEANPWVEFILPKKHKCILVNLGKDCLAINSSQYQLFMSF